MRLLTLTPPHKKPRLKPRQHPHRKKEIPVGGCFRKSLGGKSPGGCFRKSLAMGVVLGKSLAMGVAS